MLIWMTLTLLAPLGCAVLGFLARRRPDRAVGLATAGPILAAFSALVLVVASADSVATVGAPVLLRADRLGSALALFVTLMTVLVQGFARRSLASDPNGLRFLIVTSILCSATTGLGLAGGIVVMGLAWLAVSVTTVALLRHSDRARSRASARRTAVTFAVGDTALVVGLSLAIGVFGVGDLAPDAVARSLSGVSKSLVTLVGLLLVIAAAARCAQVPMQGWLPTTVESPTPASAILHAGVVNGGAVLLVRLGAITAGSFVVTLALVAVAMSSMAIGLACMRIRPDVKGALAWSTVAQMGFMLAQVAVGLVGPAIVHLMAHGMFKANLFLGSGRTVDETSKHTSPQRRVDAGALAVATVVGAVAVVVALVLVRPAFLGHPAAVMPIAFLLAALAQAVTSWQRRPHGGVAHGLAAVGAVVAATVAVAVTDGVDHWLSPSLPMALPGESTMLAWLIVGVGALTAIGLSWSAATGTPAAETGSGSLTGGQAAGLTPADHAWLRSADFAHRSTLSAVDPRAASAAQPVYVSTAGGTS